MHARFAIVVGLVMVVLETARLVLIGPHPFWPMAAKNFLTGAFLVLGGRRALPTAADPTAALLLAAWGFASGQFLVSWLRVIGDQRPLLFVLGDSAYLLLCLVALGLLLRRSRLDRAGSPRE